MTDPGSPRPRLVVISAVHPFPGHSGQQQRVKNKLLAFREQFHTTFLTVTAADDVEATTERLMTLCDEAIVMPSRYGRSRNDRFVHRVASVLYAAATGLKRSNYIVGRLELAPDRVKAAIGDRRFDFAVFEYWHAADSVPVLRAAGARSVLDMHNILWQSYAQQLRARKWMPSSIRDLAVARYRKKEERAWSDFDVVITINRDEDRYVRDLLGDDGQVIFTPMGVDLKLWPYSWEPLQPPRVAYYGGLGSPHNQRDALFCFEHVMPIVWQTVPEAELWIVGSNPPPSILELRHRDARVHVTGFVENVAPLLGTMSVVLCPWSGIYGFRSRIIEAMAVGVPVVASEEAVAGMGLNGCPGISITRALTEMARSATSLLEHDPETVIGSGRGCQKIRELYSFESTYGRLPRAIQQLDTVGRPKEASLA